MALGTYLIVFFFIFETPTAQFSKVVHLFSLRANTLFGDIFISHIIVGI